MAGVGSSDSGGFRRTRWVLFLLAACVLVGLCILMWYPREWELNGLLVDLELRGADASRHRRLREVLTQRLPSELVPLNRCRLKLDYVHFMTIGDQLPNPHHIDFVILSPQGTPWSQYDGPAEEGLRKLARMLDHAIHKNSIAVLGICGGHQFLALAFGGAVDFIDPDFASIKAERYPRGAKAERGVTLLDTIEPDPIFDGVTKHPGQFRVLESHYEEVKTLPQGFVNLARSEMSPIQLMRLPGKVVYGMAFHPERCWDEGECADKGITAGRRLLANFLLMAADAENRVPRSLF